MTKRIYHWNGCSDFNCAERFADKVDGYPSWPILKRGCGCKHLASIADDEKQVIELGDIPEDRRKKI